MPECHIYQNLDGLNIFSYNDKLVELLYEKKLVSTFTVYILDLHLGCRASLHPKYTDNTELQL